MEKAMEKLRDELAKNAGNRVLTVIGEYVCDYLAAHPSAASLILAKDKTLTGAVNAMRTEARRTAKGNCGVLTDEEGFAIVRKYFGLAEAEKAKSQTSADFDVDLDDLLGV